MDIVALRKQLEIDEGIKHEIYLDHLGLPTFENMPSNYRR